MTMHLVRGMSSLSTKRRKKKMTAGKLESLRVDHRKHNKRMKQINLHSNIMSFEDYVDYVQGNYKPKKREFVEYVPSKPVFRDVPHYPSVKTSNTICGGSTAKKEPMQYTGDLIVGIGQMHKSNAVPIMRGTKQAEDIAKMRR